MLFSYRLVTEEFDKAVQEAEAIVRSEQKKFDTARAAFDKEFKAISKELNDFHLRTQQAWLGRSFSLANRYCGSFHNS